MSSGKEESTARDNVLAVISGSHVGLVSLWDMIEYCLRDLLEALDRAERLLRARSNIIPLPGERLTTEAGQAALVDLKPLLDQCEKLSLTASARDLKRISVELAVGQITSPEGLRARVNGVLNCARDELFAVRFGFIPDSKKDYFNKESLFGKAVAHAFPDAAPDIKEAGNCLAHGLYTAAVFHLMRVMEFGLRGLSTRMKAKAIIKKLKQTTIPIELATWEEIICTLETKLAQLRMKARSADREKRIEVCNELLKDFRCVKDLWRNKVVHARESYDAEVAQSAFNHVRSFMQRIAEATI